MKAPFPYYDRGGRVHYLDWDDPADLLLLRELWDHEKRRVARDEVDGVSVSTVFLPLDHGWGWYPDEVGEEPPGDYRPLIFETMVFGGDLDGEEWRYATEEEAVEGHRRVVELVRLSLAAQ